MGVVDLTEKEKAFLLDFFETRKPSLSAIRTGYNEASAKQAAYQILRMPKSKAYLRRLWEEAESPIVMGVRERKEILSQIARGMVGDCVDEEGNIDWSAVKAMPAVKEITIEETILKSGEKARTIKVKLLNPVESITELNKMEKLYRINEQTSPQNTTNNYYLTDGSVLEKLNQIGVRTQKQLPQAEVKVVEPGEDNDSI